MNTFRLHLIWGFLAVSALECFTSTQMVPFPQQLESTALKKMSIGDAMEDAIDNIIDYFNRNGGLTAIEWYKRG